MIALSAVVLELYSINMESILQLQQQNYTEDDSIKSYEEYAFQPISGTQLNSAGQITIRVENQDAFFYPRKSW